ncbi:hypothetical protein EON65_58890 [archaeon]|nr:MAG: hypothetical protein EON65_58890 [archaeon]
MKSLLSIWLLAITATALGQGDRNLIQLKPLKKEQRLYFAPTFRAETDHALEGIGNLRNPTDSISMDKVILTGMTSLEREDSLVAQSELPENELTLIVDTSLFSYKEVWLPETFKLNRTYSSYPKSLRIKRNAQLYITPLRTDTTVRVAAQPVFIANLSDEVRYLVGYSAHLRVTQQAKDKQGQWRDIETETVGGCGMSRYICELKPNDFVLTTVLRFQGNLRHN